ncbi:PfaD family protein [Anaerobacterium chartisolvens]|uniref:PfaD family protein n=1 Tax=Anaerobacterium chartisolvens TaxID=1297424 RepID=A0A369BFC8_9FIRM|nr:PfaD family polyunsaturated fatty acid/polyketide biosynthesis protein [Anaerobacterium chartisolvens]RCX20121.1 PfaD family protein [Anaerobacterium chartisolvens]
MSMENGECDVLLWKCGAIAGSPEQVEQIIRSVDKQCYVVETDDGFKPALGGKLHSGTDTAGEPVYRCVGFIPSISGEKLGDRGFINDYGTRYAYMGGAMANGISSVEMVVELGRNGFMGSFGSGGLSMDVIKEAITSIQKALPDGPYAVNLLHGSGRGKREFELVALLLKNKVRTIEASAFITMTPALIYYRVSGLKKSVDGTVERGHKIIAKVSREEVATKFMQPAEEDIIKGLLEEGLITAEQAKLSREVPVADDVTVEADSGGHTDNRPLVSLLPAIIALRDSIQERYGYSKPVRIGAAGGISTPQAALAAFQMGAAYVVTGSVNQACIEAGTSDYVRKTLADTGMADIMMAPCADMFELGAKVQVLKKGTMFPMNAHKLYELYKKYSCIEEIPPIERERLEKRMFKAGLLDIWREVVKYFEINASEELVRAEQDAKYKMALIFRWYLGNSSRWSIAGNRDRHMDMQIWCGQSMGAFNNWVKGTYMEDVQKRRVAEVAFHIMNGAACLLRSNLISQMGVPLSPRQRNYSIARGIAFWEQV